jgi:hypothetical protein
MDYMIRFLAGGIVVFLFAVAGDVLRPKSFAGLFGAATSVALPILTLAFWKYGAGYVSTEARSMILGTIALAVYSFLVCQLLTRMRCSAVVATLGATAAWLVVAIGLKQHCSGVEDGCPIKVCRPQTRSRVRVSRALRPGRLATVVAVCGPSAGGLFLAFPAIFGAIAPTTPAWLLVGSTARSRAGVYVRGVRRRVGHARSVCVFAVEASQSRP